MYTLHQCTGIICSVLDSAELVVSSADCCNSDRCIGIYIIIYVDMKVCVLWFNFVFGVYIIMIKALVDILHVNAHSEFLHYLGIKYSVFSIHCTA